LGAGDGNFGMFFVIHAELVAGFEPGNDFADVVDIDDEAAVCAPEEVWVKEFEEVFEGAAFGLAVEVLGNDADGAVFDGGEADFSLVDEEEAGLDLDDEFAGSGYADGGLLAVEELEEASHAGLWRFAIDGGVEEAGAGAFEGL